MGVRSQDLVPKTLDEFYGYPAIKMFHSLKAKTDILNPDPVMTPPMGTVLKKSVFRNRFLQIFITPHMNLLCKCGLDVKGLYEWDNSLMSTDNRTKCLKYRELEKIAFSKGGVTVYDCLLTTLGHLKTD